MCVIILPFLFAIIGLHGCGETPPPVNVVDKQPAAPSCTLPEKLNLASYYTNPHFVACSKNCDSWVNMTCFNHCFATMVSPDCSSCLHTKCNQTQRTSYCKECLGSPPSFAKCTVPEYSTSKKRAGLLGEQFMEVFAAIKPTFCDNCYNATTQAGDGLCLTKCIENWPSVDDGRLWADMFSKTQKTIDPALVLKEQNMREIPSSWGARLLKECPQNCGDDDVCKNNWATCAKGVLDQMVVPNEIVSEDCAACTMSSLASNTTLANTKVEKSTVPHVDPWIASSIHIYSCVKASSDAIDSPGKESVGYASQIRNQKSEATPSTATTTGETLACTSSEKTSLATWGSNPHFVKCAPTCGTWLNFTCLYGCIGGMVSPQCTTCMQTKCNQTGRTSYCEECLGQVPNLASCTAPEYSAALKRQLFLGEQSMEVYHNINPTVCKSCYNTTTYVWNGTCYIQCLTEWPRVDDKQLWGDMITKTLPEKDPGLMVVSESRESWGARLLKECPQKCASDDQECKNIWVTCAQGALDQMYERNVVVSENCAACTLNSVGNNASIEIGKIPPGKSVIPQAEPYIYSGLAKFNCIKRFPVVVAAAAGASVISQTDTDHNHVRRVKHRRVHNFQRFSVSHGGAIENEGK